MHRIAVGLGSLSAVVLLAATPNAHAGTPSPVTIGVRDNFFSPIDSATLPYGTTVTWEWQLTSASHNVVEDHGLFSSGVPTAVPGTTASATVSAGTFHYVCETHTDNGMRGTLHVAPSASAGPTGNRFHVGWAVPGTDTGSVFDVQFRVDGGRWKSWLRNSSEPSATFGEGGVPAKARAGRRYGFRVRSQEDALSATAVSLWSPSVAFTP